MASCGSNVAGQFRDVFTIGSCSVRIENEDLKGNRTLARCG
jgi:hypothetical protein